jgi:tRNA-specific 2-thiouridylase
MKLHDNDAYHQSNFSKAKIVANYLNIDLHFHDLSREFRDEVYNYFIDGYKSGITPNPCIMCNRTIKFGAMVDFADSLGIEKVSTGHYLRSDREFIYKAKDQSKDQSYFLAEIKKEVIPRLIFPLGEWLKTEVKEFAAKIPALEAIVTQRESSEICFVENEYTEILQKHMDIDMEGEVLDSEGNIVGKHKGYMHYTIGKRRGFSVDGAHDPHYVMQLNPVDNQIVVGTHEKLSEQEFAIEQINLFEDSLDFKCDLKVRYRTTAVPARVTIESGRGWVVLEQPVFGLARGQFAVFYEGEKLLGGGVIV